MIQTKFLILAALISGCGKNVQVSTTHLSEQSSLAQSEALSVQNEGSLIKRKTSSEVDRLTHDGKTYTVSAHSSYVAITYLDSKALGSTTPVKFKGIFQNSEVLIETIQNK